MVKGALMGAILLCPQLQYWPITPLIRYQEASGCAFAGFSMHGTSSTLRAFLGPVLPLSESRPRLADGSE